MNFVTFINNFKRDYFDLILKTGKTFPYKPEVNLDRFSSHLQLLLIGETFTEKLEDEGIVVVLDDWVDKYVPKKFKINENTFYMFVSKVFTECTVLDSKVTIKKIEKHLIPEDAPIFNLDRLWGAATYINRVEADIQALVDDINDYEDLITFKEKDYTIIKEVKIPDKEIYPDSNFALTKEELEGLNAWQEDHEKKFHKKGHPGKGAIGVSNFEYRMGLTSIGQYWDCVCTECKNKDKKNKKRSNYTYDIRSLG